MVYLIFDNVELTRGWNGGILLLAALFQLSELTRLPNLGLLFISNVGIDAYQACSISREPLPLYFRDYNDNELYQILLLQRPNMELYASFLRFEPSFFNQTWNFLNSPGSSFPLAFPRSILSTSSDFETTRLSWQCLRIVVVTRTTTMVPQETRVVHLQLYCLA